MNHSQEIDEVLFESASGFESLEARQAFLDLIRQGDPSQSKRLGDLLALQDQAEGFFREAAGARTLVGAELGEELIDPKNPDLLAEPFNRGADERPGNRIGRYQLVNRIGEGGCGVVYLAEQLEPVRRQVAMKIIRLGMDTEQVIARFETERQSLALMDHPYIARVLDGGATESGRPFFVMEWVRGLRITDYCDEHRLDIRQRIDLFIEVCKGIQHAHQKGVIHRDIKPSNILVSDDAGKPVPKVIDFGVAKAVAGGLGDSTAITIQDQLVGTPAYMSPEQADLRERDIDTRSDVYSLGMLLYELLVGRTPFDSKELVASGLSEMRRLLEERDPPLPSSMLMSMDAGTLGETAARRSCEPARWITTVRGDLDSVVMKAVEKDRQSRYETVNGLVMDLQRYIDHEPVIARPRNRSYLIRKFVRRNRLAVGAAAAIVASLLLGLGVASAYYLRERKAREEQARLRGIAEKLHASEQQRLAEAREWEKFAQVSILLSEGKTEEAEKLLRNTPLSSIKLTPQSSAVLRSLGNWNALRGRWLQSAECFKMLLKADDLNRVERLTNSLDLVMIGSGVFEGGKPDDYSEFCKWSLDHFGNSTSDLDASRVLHVVLLKPTGSDTLNRLAPLKALLEKSRIDPATAGVGRDRELAIWRAFGLALLEYRQGNFEKSRHWADRALGFKAARDHINGAIEPVHAMACFRLGDVASAKATLQRSRKRIDKAFSPDLPAAYEPFGQYQGYWWDWIIARILFREAEALIEGNPGLGK